MGVHEFIICGTTPRDGRFCFVYSRKRFFWRRNGYVNISKDDSNPKSRATSVVLLALATDGEDDSKTGAPVKYVMFVSST